MTQVYMEETTFTHLNCYIICCISCYQELNVALKKNENCKPLGMRNINFGITASVFMRHGPTDFVYSCEIQLL